MADFDDYFALHAKGAFREAYGVLQEILHNDARWSKVGDLYVWCADLELQVTNDARKAQRLLEKAWRLGCHFPGSYHNLHGFLQWQTGDREEGIRELEKSVELEASITNLTRLGVALSSEGDERAADVLRRILDQDPDNCLAHVYLGILSSQAGDRGRAILLARRAEKLGASAIDYWEISRLYQEVQEFQCAVDAYHSAERLGYERKGDLWAALAVCHLRLGDKGMARKYLQWAVKHDPENGYVKEVLETNGDLLKEPEV